MSTQLSQADREEIEQIVGGLPGRKLSILAMRLERPNEVTIFTGVFRGRRFGRGQELRATKAEGRWSVEMMGEWRA